jgi:hypothetical protein
VQRRRFGATEPTVKIAGKSYVLAQQQGRPVYSSGTRAIEGAPSDDFEIRLENDGRGVGRSSPLSRNCLPTFEKRIYPRPKLRSAVLTNWTGSDPPRWSFEAQDANGKWYLFVIGPGFVSKVELGIAANPTVHTTEGPFLAGPPAPWNANDRLGQPAYMFSARMGGFRWMVPLNNGDRFAVLDSVGINGAANVWTIATINKAGTGEDGALAFLTLPSGKAVRAVADNGNAGTAKISILTASADAETVGNWGGAFPVDAEGFRILALMAFDETVIVKKQNGYFTAIEQGNGTIAYRTLLPDAEFAEIQPQGRENSGRPIVWHGKMLLPTPTDFWTHNLVNASPAGPDAISYNPEDEEVFDYLTARFGRVGAVSHGGKWLYAAYEKLDVVYILAATENDSGDSRDGALLYFPIVFQDTSRAAPQPRFLHRMRNTDSIYLILAWTEETGANQWTIYSLMLGGDSGPYAKPGYWGEPSSSGDHWFEEQPFTTDVLLREVYLEISRSSVTPDEISWRPVYALDGGAKQTLSSRNTSGTVFFTPGSNDRGRRAFFGAEWVTTAGWTAGAIDRVPYLRSMTVRGSYLPDVSDPLQFVVDVARTAARRRISRKAVLDELHGYRSSRQTWTDPTGAAGHIRIQSTEETAPRRAASLEGLDVVTVKGMLIEYS